MRMVLPKNDPTRKFVRLIDIKPDDFVYMDQRAIPTRNAMSDSCLVHWTATYAIRERIDKDNSDIRARKLVRAYCEIGKRNIASTKYKGNPQTWLQYFDLSEYDQREYQLAGMERLWQLKTAILADDVGIGKTPQALGVMARVLANQSGCCVVVTTASTKGQWLDETNRFMPQLKAVMIDGGPQDRAQRWRQSADLYICSYEHLQRDADYKQLRQKPLLMVVFDEAYRLGNTSSKTHNRACDLVRFVPRVALLHATPIERGLENLYALMRLLDANVFGSYDQFKSRFMKMQPKPKYVLVQERIAEKQGRKFYWREKIESYINLQDFRFRISKYIIRRTIKDVDLELPGIIPLPVYCTLNVQDDRDYHKQTQAALSSRIPNVAALRGALTASKVEDLKARLLSGDLAGERVIVFSQYATAIKKAAAMLADFNPMVIMGETPGVERRQIVRNFGSSSRGLLLMTEAGSRGLNLQAAYIIVNLDLPWSHAQLRQRIGRVCRIGQKSDHVRVLNYVAQRRRGGKTVDHWLLSVVGDRRDLFTDVLRDDYEDEIGVDEITPTRFREVLRQVASGKWGPDLYEAAV